MFDDPPRKRPGAHGPALAVIVPSYRRAGALAALLTRLMPQLRDDRAVEVIIVNDGSDGPDYARALAPFRNSLRYVVLEENAGPAAARNRGAAQTGADVLVFTDDDCLPPSDFIAEIRRLTRRHRTAGVIAGRSYPVLGHPPPFMERLLAAAGHHPGAVVEDGRVICAATAIMAIHRDLFERMGGFDERLRFGEDYNLSQRLIAAGETIHLARHWWTGHGVNDTLSQASRRRTGYGHGVACDALVRRDWTSGYFSMSNGPLAVTRTLLRRAATYDALFREARFTVPERLAGGAMMMWMGARELAGFRAGLRQSAEIGESPPPPDVLRGRWTPLGERFRLVLEVTSDGDAPRDYVCTVPGLGGGDRLTVRLAPRDGNTAGPPLLERRLGARWLARRLEGDTVRLKLSLAERYEPGDYELSVLIG